MFIDISNLLILLSEWRNGIVITSKNKKRITIFILILLIASIYYFVEESSKYQFMGYDNLVAIATDADISKFNTKT